MSGGGGTSLQVHVTNGGSAAVGTPLLVLAWEDSLCVEDPPGLAKNKHTGDYLTYMDADSSVADSAHSTSHGRTGSGTSSAWLMH